MMKLNTTRNKYALSLYPLLTTRKKRETETNTPQKIFERDEERKETREIPIHTKSEGEMYLLFNDTQKLTSTTDYQQF